MRKIRDKTIAKLAAQASRQSRAKRSEPPELGRRTERWTKALDPHAGDKYGEFWGNETWVVIAPWNEVARYLTSGVDRKVDGRPWVEPLEHVLERRRRLAADGYRLTYED
jgi:hypothetical protein